MSIVKVCLAVFLCGYLALAAASEQDMFHQFMKDFGRKYSTQAEYELRFNNFVKYLKRVEKAQKASPGAKFAVNEFADYHAHELNHKVGAKAPADQLAWSCLANGVTVPKMPTDNLPSSFDWRSQGVVSEVKDQQSCGSCWAFSTIGNIESQYAIKNKKLIDFSEQLLVDCSQGCSVEYQYGPVCNQGCDGGWQWNAFFDVLNWGGVETESDYPYTGVDGTCQRTASKMIAPITNYTCLSQYNGNPADEQQMAAYLVANGPISVALDADLLFSYTSGVLNPSPSGCDGSVLDHALLVVGYGVDSTQSPPVNFWIVKNSWGASWGEQGYFRIARGTGACGINNAVSSAQM